MEKKTAFWKSCRLGLGRLWRNAFRPWLRRRNIPYFVLLGLVAFLLTTGAARRRQPGVRLPVRSDTAAAAEEPRIMLGQSRDELSAAWEAMTERHTVGDETPASAASVPLVFASPCRGTVALGRGWRREEPGATWVYHRGVDIRVSDSDSVRASAPGRVLRVAEWEEGGLSVELTHDGGWRTVYGRLGKVEVKPGAILPAGGLVGCAAGDLVHFELWREQAAVEPGTVIPDLR